MSSVANLQPDPAPILACTISRDVQNFDLLIDDMEQELGENWGDLGFEDALIFLNQPEFAQLKFVAIAVDSEDETDLARIGDVIRTAKEKAIKVILIADQVSPIALHQLLRLGADDFVPYPLPEGALHEAIARQPAPPRRGRTGPCRPTGPCPPDRHQGQQQRQLQGQGHQVFEQVELARSQGGGQAPPEAAGQGPAQSRRQGGNHADQLTFHAHPLASHQSQVASHKSPITSR